MLKLYAVSAALRCDPLLKDTNYCKVCEQKELSEQYKPVPRTPKPFLLLCSVLKLYAVSAALRRDRLLDGGGNHDKKVVYYILCTTITIAREDAGAQCQNFITSFATKELSAFIFLSFALHSLQLTQFCGTIG